MSSAAVEYYLLFAVWDDLRADETKRRWMPIMVMAILIAHGSIDLNAQCAEADYG